MHTKTKNLGFAYFFMFLAIFVPMLFSEVPEEKSQYVPPAIADLQNFNSPIVTVAPGVGGPIDELIWGWGEEPEEIPEPPEPVEITRMNKLNYSNAIFPVFPATISSEFGWREAPCDECSSDHQGVDFVPGAGADVVAILDGLVVEAGINGGYGTWVVIRHIVPSISEPGEFEHWKTLYAHLEEGSIPDDVGIGSIVEKGQLIGKVGSTGTSTGPHLHFELLINNEAVDPIPLLAEYIRIELYENGTERFISYE